MVSYSFVSYQQENTNEVLINCKMQPCILIVNTILSERELLQLQSLISVINFSQVLRKFPEYS